MRELLNPAALKNALLTKADRLQAGQAAALLSTDKAKLIHLQAAFHDAMYKVDLSDNFRKDFAQDVFGVDSFNKLTVFQADALVGWLSDTEAATLEMVLYRDHLIDNFMSEEQKPMTEETLGFPPIPVTVICNVHRNGEDVTLHFHANNENEVDGVLEWYAQQEKAHWQQAARARDARNAATPAYMTGQEQQGGKPAVVTPAPASGGSYEGKVCTDVIDRLITTVKVKDGTPYTYVEFWKQGAKYAHNASTRNDDIKQVIVDRLGLSELPPMIDRKMKITYTLGKLKEGKSGNADWDYWQNLTGIEYL